MKTSTNVSWLGALSPALKTIACFFLIHFFVPTALSQVIENPIPKPVSSYTARSGEVFGDLLFMVYEEDATKYYIYEFKNGSWQAKGNIVYGQQKGLLAASGNKVALKKYINNSITVYTYQSGSWVATANIPPATDFHFVNIEMDGSRIVTDQHKCTDEYCEEEVERFVSVYDYNGSSWVNTYELPHVTFNPDQGWYGYALAYSGNHIAVNEVDASIIRLYTFKSGSWIQSGILTNNDEYYSFDFARDLDLDGNRLVVNTAVGFAVVYEYNGSNWVKTAQLTPNESAEGGAYISGYQIAISGNTVVFNTSQFYDDYLLYNVAVFEYKNSDWYERLSFVSEDLLAGVKFSLSGKNLYIDDQLTPKIYRINNFNEADPEKILASDGHANASFGQSVGIWSDMAIVAAPFDNEKGNSAGAAYLYQNSGTTWDEIIKLTATDAKAGDRFGIAVAISGNFAIVGAPLADINGKKDAGAAYIFQLEGNTWIQKAKLTASDGEVADRFGSSVAIEAFIEYENFKVLAVVGSPYDDYANQNGAGSAYVYQKELSGNNWTEMKKLTPADPKKGDQFGKSVAVKNFDYSTYHPTIVVGSPYDDDKGRDSGSAYLFDYQSQQWKQIKKLTASDGEESDRFGLAVAMDKQNIIVGAPLSDDDGEESGSTYVYLGAFIEKKLTAPDASARDRFGSAVAMYGNRAVVGSSYADHSGGTNAGAVYAYVLEGETTKTKKLIANARTGDRLGYAVGISGNHILAGAYHDNDPAMGSNAGSAYVLDLYPVSDMPASTLLARTVNTGDQKKIEEELQEQEKLVTDVQNMKIFPNPFTSEFQIQLNNNTAPVEITILDQLGRKLYQQQFTGEESQQLLNIDLSKNNKIMNGMMFLGVKSKNGSSKWMRLLKQ